jgi:hypothetical protein
MVFSGLPEHGWRDWLYGSIAELADPAKALRRWLDQGAAGPAAATGPTSSIR